ncbi:MAG: hypothetical protein JRI67_12370 [Deltaproteobacteria bacterium]|nr:hypothetical protein [Deltaproteobacteria bacterium]
MTASLTQKQNLLFQSYFTVVLLVELKNNSLLESAYYEDMTFGAQWIKEELRSIGIDNQGCALMTLYAMLVLPRELVLQAYSAEYDDIDVFLQANTQNTTTNYRGDDPTIKFLQHIRNAVSHGHVEFDPNNVVVFSDENPRNNESFTTELPLTHLGPLIDRLQMVHIKYIRDLQQQTGQTT